MKIMMTLMLMMMLSCGNALSLSEQTAVVKQGIDSIDDIESRFGEPIKLYKERAGNQAFYVAKYENILGYEVVYLRFAYVTDMHNSKLKSRKQKNSIFTYDLRDQFKQDWVLYEVDKRPNKHS